MLVLGIDPSLNTFAMVTLDEQGGVVKSSCHREAEKMRGMSRLAYLRECVETRIAEDRKKSDGLFIAIEGYSFGSKGRATISLGELGGVVRLLLYDLQSPYIELPPARVKKFATGAGSGAGATKSQVAVGVLKKYGVDFSTEDETDAFVIAEICRSFLVASGILHPVKTPDWTEYQKEVLRDLFKAEGKKCPKNLSTLATVIKKHRSLHKLPK